jgi:hypothetical protein
MKALLLCLALAVGAAQAGRPCDTSTPQAADVVRGLQLAERTAAALDASGAEVLVLARAGQDLSAHGLRWSHLGLVYREPDSRAWRVLHKLNHCGSDTAALYRQGLAEFFLDSPHRYEAAYAVLKPELQQRLLPVLQDNVRAAQWHERRYNLVAYPWATRYQQSNQWLLETLAGAAEAQATDRRRAQAWLQLQGYAPTRLRLSPLTRLGARMTRANVAFDDHPDSLRFANRIDTVGADSVFTWLSRSGWGEAARVMH